MDSLEELLAEKGKTDQTPASEVKPQEEEKDKEVARKEEQLANLNKAIAQANDDLRKARKAKKEPSADEEELPKINLEDPSAKAWDRHINEKVSPMQGELEKEKEEVRTFALQEFLKDKPALASSPEKMKELISTYDRLKTASERTREGVLLDLRKAYAAVFHEQLIGAAQRSRIEKAESDILLADIAVSRGATAYQETKDTSKVPLSEDDKKILDRWGIKPEEWQEDRKKYG